MEEYTVYKHTAPNWKVYIGITKSTPNGRWRNGKGYDNQSYFAKAIKKYGWENFSHEIIASGLSKEEAIQMEISLIKQYNSNNPQFGYNISGGGDGAGIVSERTRAMTSERNRREWASGKRKGHPQSEEVRRIISEKKRGIHYGGTGRKPKKVMCIETGVIYESAIEASKSIGCGYTGIYNCCNGKAKTAYGYKWQYAS